MNPTITAFETSPDEGQGQARDMRIRWALEEVGQPYDVRLLSFDEMKQPSHLTLHPFGQIPTYEQDGLSLFETGAIALHIAETYPGLLPHDRSARMRAITWLFAALNTVEPPIVEREQAYFIAAGKLWQAELIQILEARIRVRLDQLSQRLGEAEWLDGTFSIGDLTMVMVLRRMDGWGLLELFRNLAAYVARGEERPAFRRAFDAQRAVYEASRS